MTPLYLPVIKHFLLDVEDGKFDGFPELDIYVQLMENKALRESLNLPKNAGGMLVTGVAENSNLIGLINPGDVILDIDGYNIGRDGKVMLESGLRVESTHLEYLKQVGDTLQLKLFRDGKTFTQKIPLTARKQKINQKEYDNDPTYFVFAGFVFQPLSNGYLSSNQNALYYMLSYVPAYTMQGYRKIIPERIKNNRDQVIVLSRVLPDAINQGYKNMEQSVVYSVNGTVVKDMPQLIKLIEAVKEPYLKIVTDFGNVITLDMEKARKRNATIMEKYQVYVDRSPDLR